MEDERLSRMETKIDKLSKAVVAMARMEERMITVFKLLDFSDDAWKKYDERMNEIERKALIRGQKIAFAERIFWMILTGAGGLCFVDLR
tara:strand:+ start:606 stop:872 length:267 start_codon:yes stop_codon:yes gene_type:complete